MITRLEIDGFKSLRGFAVDLEPLTVFIGPNSAGKSNILEALALLSRLASQPVDEAFKRGRGLAIDQFTRHGGEAARTMKLAVELALPVAGQEGVEADIVRYRYELAIERLRIKSGAERIVAADEHLRPIAAGETDKELIDASPDRSLPSSGPRFLGESTTLFKQRFFGPLAGWKSGTAFTTVHPAHIESIGNMLSAFRLLHPETSALRASSERIGADMLAPDGSNLPRVIASLPEPLIGELRADLVSLVPGISSFEVVPEGDQLRIDFELSGGDRMPARLISEGTLRILALLTALRVEPRPSVIGMEEPENGVYPGRLRRLLELLQESMALPGASDEEDPAHTPGRPVQLLITTHSPVVLAAFRSQPQHLRYVDLVRRDGQLVTRARRVGTPAEHDRGQITVSLREIDRLLQAADSEVGSDTGP